jgi:hypothetical protein
MALKELSIGLGIMAGTAGIANSSYGLYQNMVVKPSQNVEYNLALMTETPLVVETVEIQPVSDMAMRVEVTVKVFKAGDILVESGSRRQFIPFKLASNSMALNAIISTAIASETQLIDGVEYDVEVMRYVEMVNPLPDNKIKRVRTYQDGNVETSVIDIRSNQVLETTTVQKTLTDAERKAIEISPYKKKIFIPRKTSK